MNTDKNKPRNPRKGLNTVNTRNNDKKRIERSNKRDYF